MKQSIGPLGEINLLTDDELRASLGHHFSAQIREWYRGVDYLGFSGVGNGTGLIGLAGPDSGYVWSLKLVSAQLSVSGTLSVYPGDVAAGAVPVVAPFDSIASVTNGTNNEASMRFTSNTVVLKDQQSVTLYCGSGNILYYRITVKQVPAEMQGKL